MFQQKKKKKKTWLTKQDLNLQNKNLYFSLLHVSLHNPLSLSGNEQLRHAAELSF